MMEIRIRRAAQTDVPALLGLIEALAHFEELPPPDEAARARLQRDGWPADGQSPRFQAWLAEIISEAQPTPLPVAYAITFETYSSFLALPTLYLEDIFVLPEYRRHGVGSHLMHRLVQAAWENGCGRMEWVVLDWNTNAQRFYQKLGGQHLTEWFSYRLTREEMPTALEKLIG